ncbi:MAG: beta-lactamase family protein [Fuerstiella sp.]|nr:beta-lactamase family protein [Fuerstiella sp.]MCP4855658.1 beta-lactamase family protein [Fuerstiella sp.]
MSAIILTVVRQSLAQDIELRAALDKLLADGEIVAAQAIVGRGETLQLNHAIGTTMPRGTQNADADTMFCIGSCSKPFASAVVMSLIEDGTLRLNVPIDRYMPAFGTLKIAGGGGSRAPTMSEVLSHRAGFFSQKKNMTPRQARYIRDFTLTLKESVEGIAAERLLAEPGAEYAYSGAGYCVAGRVAEVLSGMSFEQLLQTRLADPLKLTRTTFFPNRAEANIAAGGTLKNGMGTPSAATPHLTRPELSLPLIGGSLYSTAQDTARFAAAVAGQGRLASGQIMKPNTWQVWTSRPYSDGRYGFGWGLSVRNGKTIQVSHTGALAASRSSVVVNLENGAYGVVHYTIVMGRPGGRSAEPGARINKALAATMKRAAQR